MMCPSTVAEHFFVAGGRLRVIATLCITDRDKGISLGRWIDKGIDDHAHKSMERDRPKRAVDSASSPRLRMAMEGAYMPAGNSPTLPRLLLACLDYTLQILLFSSSTPVLFSRRLADDLGT